MTTIEHWLLFLIEQAAWDAATRARVDDSDGERSRLTRLGVEVMDYRRAMEGE